MIARNRPTRRRSDDDSVLPLINVVFLLLIFFMVAGRLSASDPFRISPPRSASEAAVDIEEMLILVGADGRIALDGTELDAATLAKTVGERIAEAPETPVQLKADGRAEADHVIALMEKLRAAGLPKLQLLTVPERDR